MRSHFVTVRLPYSITYIRDADAGAVRCTHTASLFGSDRGPNLCSYSITDPVAKLISVIMANTISNFGTNCLTNSGTDTDSYATADVNSYEESFELSYATADANSNSAADT